MPRDLLPGDRLSDDGSAAPDVTPDLGDDSDDERAPAMARGMIDATTDPVSEALEP